MELGLQLIQIGSNNKNLCLNLVHLWDRWVVWEEVLLLKDKPPLQVVMLVQLKRRKKKLSRKLISMLNLNHSMLKLKLNSSRKFVKFLD